MASYISVGLFTTGGMWITWNVLYFLIPFVIPASRGSSVLFSSTQYIASVGWIFPSFYLNRKLTFRDKALTASKAVTMGKVLFIYSIAPLIASLATFTIQKIIVTDLESIVFVIRMGVKTYNIPYLYFALQVVGIGIGLLLNFFGQYFLVYGKNDKN